MSAVVTLSLRCDGTDRGKRCTAEFRPAADVRTVRAMRTVAYRDHHWSTRGRDLCPTCRQREVGA
ncbi:hypothetical protein [Streptomyces noursei]|uniref:hypothetical protein n=1 Tax=Streptomyces noursei TaxID=1971 RepID=UPI0023B82572|nr:hypothetical protein [Streptomyces noursei]